MKQILHLLVALLVPVLIRAETPIVAAEVGQEKISFAELNKELERRTAPIKDTLSEEETREARQRLLSTMIDRKLLLHAARESGVKAKKDEVELQMEQAENTLGRKFEPALQAADLTKASFRSGIEEDLTISRYLAEKVFSALEVAPEEIQHAFNTQPTTWAAPVEVRARHILFKAKSDEEAEARRAEAEQLLQRVKKKPDDFDSLARKHSEGAGKNRGGDLGFFTSNQLAPDFTEAVLRMPLREPQLIRTKLGLHIVRVEERRGEEKPELEKVARQISEKLLNDKKRIALERELARLRAETKVIVFLQ